MELIKNRMNTSKTKTFKIVQITLEEDLNVPDSRQDVDKIIQTKGEIMVQEVEPMVDKVRIEGELFFRILYVAPGGRLTSFQHHFPFEETIYMEGILPADSVKANGELEDLNVSIINSRKLEIRSLMGIAIRAMDTEYMEGAIEIAGDDSIRTCQKTCHVTGLVVNKKDMARLREEAAIPTSKPNVSEVVWYSVNLRNPDIRLKEDSIEIKGELLLFVLYQGEEENMPLQNLEWELPFETEIDCRDCREDMIGNIRAEIGSKQIEIKPDADGEERVLSLECTLDLDMKIYEEREMNFLWDAYAPTKQLELTRNHFDYESLIIKNNSKTKVSQRVRVKEHQGKMLQICHVDGEVKIDDTECNEDGIQIDGVIAVDLLYISSDDRYPMNSLTAMVPFSHLVEAKGIKPDDHYEITGSVEQIGAIMLDGDEIELRISLMLDVIAFAAKQTSTVIEVEQKPFDEAAFEEMPGIIGYIVRENDTLWEIAKQFYTTPDQIQTLNNIGDDTPKPGSKLIIVKDVRDPLEV